VFDIRRLALLAVLFVSLLVGSFIVNPAASPVLADGPGGLITPGAGAPGTPFQLSFTGFEPNTDLTLSLYGGNPAVFTPFNLPNVVTTNGAGAATATYVPDAAFINRLYGQSAFTTYAPGLIIAWSARPNPLGFALLAFYRFYACDRTNCIEWQLGILPPPSTSKGQIFGGGGSAGIQREVCGLEKTFLDGLTTIGQRVPLFDLPGAAPIDLLGFNPLDPNLAQGCGLNPALIERYLASKPSSP